ncbi:LolA family protein [Pseudonocardia acaciae]|uniref:LolA family protein n=1 Tax=Pseudonocardia acaciae TaxID=551276 RepID=UPI00048CC518|nr:hypothetical protein [Pseudonocardia acaciae]
MSTVKIALMVSGVAAVALVSVLVTGPFGGPAPAPAGAPLPPVSAGELIASIRGAKPGPMAGTVSVDVRLGPAAASLWPRRGSEVARLWSDGDGRRRVSLPGADGERTIVDDGDTVWCWNSTTRSVMKFPSGPAAGGTGTNASPGPLGLLAGDEPLANPADATTAVLGLLASDSMARVDPPTSVARRDAYQLVLAPLPTERTMLREIRVAVDTQTRLPLEVSVLANGLPEPALRIAFTDVGFGRQDPALFRFAPAPGVAVRERPAPPPAPTLVGKGWDTVVVRRDRGAAATCGGGRAAPFPPRLSSPISGPWGQGRLVSTPIGTAVLTADGRLATGAVPVQVVTEALAGTEAPAR